MLTAKGGFLRHVTGREMTPDGPVRTLMRELENCRPVAVAKAGTALLTARKYHVGGR